MPREVAACMGETRISPEQHEVARSPVRAQERCRLGSHVSVQIHHAVALRSVCVWCWSHFLSCYGLAGCGAIWCISKTNFFHGAAANRYAMLEPWCRKWRARQCNRRVRQAAEALKQRAQLLQIRPCGRCNKPVSGLLAIPARDRASDTHAGVAVFDALQVPDSDSIIREAARCV